MNTLVWFQRNLRVASNPALDAAYQASMQEGGAVVGAFFYDEQYTGEFCFADESIPRCGELRAGFLWQSLLNLRNNLQQIPLIIQCGEAAGLLVELCQQLDIQEVHTQKLWAHEEQFVAETVRSTLEAIGITLVEHECYTLLTSTIVTARHPDALSSFSKFRRKVEREVGRDVEHSAEVAFHSLINSSERTEAQRVMLQEVAALSENRTESPIPIAEVSEPRSVLPFVGGESAGEQRLSHYCQQALGHYKETRNGLIGADYSSKLSPWLNLGCISPQQVLRAVREYEHRHGANASTEWLIVELLWRDFFQYLAAQRRGALFCGRAEPMGSSRAGAEKMGSVSAVSDTALTDPSLYGTKASEFAQWRTGTTESEFINANMRELNSTGFMSNRGRQNVASMLIHDLHIDWRWGAAWFEAKLLDYDPGSNYGNWQYIGGLAANPRGGSWFNIEKQANVYDTDGAYRALWASSQLE
ncbi:DASH family cryptochrome [Aliidiomarina sp.]|uniref:DASH family cryptochrome n=1 Tax=Aliidiomarina sp. TaxID=1872439 RepID=UPI003A4D2026